ncbi:T9SS type A sorting domain-containing protein [bacterium]|nr:T9SS type A sorting domain-containing protein [bacterium]
MRNPLRVTSIIVLSLMFISVLTADAQFERPLRSVDQPLLSSPRNLGADEDSLLGYAELENLEYFWTIPNEYGDLYYNVWFESPYEDFYLLEAHIPLYVLQDEDGNSLIGEPGLRVIIWQTGEQLYEYGFPIEPIDSLDVPFEDLVFSTESIVVNIIDLRKLRISMSRDVQFHIGVDVIQNDSTDQIDTLAIFSDYENEFDRSRLWAQDDEGFRWFKTMELGIQGQHRAFNWGIWALVSDEEPIWSAPTLLQPNGINVPVAIQSASPNPFNSSMRIDFSVKMGLPYTALLYDQLGRQLRLINQGIGSGPGRIQVDGQGLSAGMYYLHILAGNGSASQRLIYIK